MQSGISALLPKIDNSFGSTTTNLQKKQKQKKKPNGELTKHK